MFKAVHASTGEFFISVDQDCIDRKDELRSMSQDGELVCQGCHRAVIFKAGEIRVHHFAHKALPTAHSAMTRRSCF